MYKTVHTLVFTHIQYQKLVIEVQRSAKRRGCLLSYSQAEPGRELTQPSPRLLAEPCTEIGKKAWLFAKLQPGRARKRIDAT